MEKPKDLIFILEEQLKFIKMTVTEREYLENTINKLKESINYTRCCTELKDKEIISFEEWLFYNNYKKLFDYFVKDGKSFTESELMQIYKDLPY